MFNQNIFWKVTLGNIDCLLQLSWRFSFVLAVAGDVDKDAVQHVEAAAGRHQLLLILLNLLADT